MRHIEFPNPEGSFENPNSGLEKEVGDAEATHENPTTKQEKEQIECKNVCDAFNEFNRIEQQRILQAANEN
jgi:hypothetical protein